MRLLHVVSSPRGEDSVSIGVAGHFLDALREHHPDLEVDTLDVWDAGLPEFDARTIQLIDLVCRRGSLFTFDGRTYGPALDVERALIVAVRGQSHDTLALAPPQHADHHVDFLRFWLQVIGVRDVTTMLVEHTWDSLAPVTPDRARAEAERLAATF